MFIKLKYSESTGDIKTLDGMLITTWAGLEGCEIEEDQKVSIDEVVKLKEAGFTSEEIIEMHKKGVV
jgi:hypothetical protein